MWVGERERKTVAGTIESMDCFLKSVQIMAFRMARLATGQRDEALDIVQDAMIKFVSRYGGKPKEQWRPLFFRTLNTGIIDWHRKQKVRSIVHWFGFSHEYDCGGRLSEEPEFRHEKARAMSQLERTLNTLPRRQKQAVLLRVWDGMSTEDAALAMGVSRSSVKTHLARGLSALRLQLGEYWP